MTFLYWRFHWQLVPLYYLDLQEWKSFNRPAAGNSEHTEQYIYVATQSGAPPLVVGEAAGIIVVEVTEESTKVIVAHGAPYKFPGKWDPTIYKQPRYEQPCYKGQLETQSERIKASKAHGIPICVAKLHDSWELAEGPTVLAMSAETCVLPLPECGIVISGREPIVFSSSDE